MKFKNEKKSEPEAPLLLAYVLTDSAFIISHNQATTNTQFSILLKILYCNEIMQCNVEDLFSLPLSVSLLRC